jgi:hypothetical protein
LLNTETVSRVRESYTRNNGNIHAVARELGISAEECRRVFPQHRAVLREPEDPTPARDKQGRPDVGRKALRDRIVSVRHVQSGGWPDADRAAITGARRRYDNGTHDMATGREGPWLILYSWKRRKPVKPRHYFYGPFS